MAKETKDLEIVQKHKGGASIYSLSKEYGVDKKTIQKIIKQGKYYLNLCTGEIVFTSKSISLEEQQTHYLFWFCETQNENVFKVQTDKFISKRTENFRLSVFLDKHQTTIKRWRKKKEKLVECDEGGDIAHDVYKVIPLFLAQETIVFSRYASSKFYVDENGYVKGMDLWYVKVSQKWLYYLKDYAWYYVAWTKTDKEVPFEDYCKNRLGKTTKHEQDEEDEKDYTFINCLAGKELGKWLVVNLNVHTKEYLKSALDRYTSFREDALEGFDDVDIPDVLYVKKKGYYCRYIPQNLKDRVAPYITYKDDIVSSLDSEDIEYDIDEAEFDEVAELMSA